MCENCVKDEYPDRESMCLESGAYMQNFSGCSACKATGDVVRSTHMSDEEIHGQQIITYKHTCSQCSHIIAEHEYRFHVEDGFQVRYMLCISCKYIVIC